MQFFQDSFFLFFSCRVVLTNRCLEMHHPRCRLCPQMPHLPQNTLLQIYLHQQSTCLQIPHHHPRSCLPTFLCWLRNWSQRSYPLRLHNLPWWPPVLQNRRIVKASPQRIWIRHLQNLQRSQSILPQLPPLLKVRQCQQIPVQKQIILPLKHDPIESKSATTTLVVCFIWGILPSSLIRFKIFILNFNLSYYQVGWFLCLMAYHNLCRLFNAKAILLE